MTDNVAILKGYTKEIIANNDHGLELFLLVQHDADLDDRFKAWDIDCQEFIRVNGWLFSFDEIA